MFGLGLGLEDPGLGQDPRGLDLEGPGLGLEGPGLVNIPGIFSIENPLSFSVASVQISVANSRFCTALPVIVEIS